MKTHARPSLVLERDIELNGQSYRVFVRGPDVHLIYVRVKTQRNSYWKGVPAFRRLRGVNRPSVTWERVTKALGVAS